ncbi:MAG: COX15/CtaA family protein [Alphaproteobacteria bacterium]|nr:COX15/CtaA family protein [Alphaproteobacteria bacterium]MBV9420446.1 COX15/CtaA family protein [Alphaproteobacteria bacterium]
MSDAATVSPPIWRSRRAVGFWLLGIAAIILAMITVGGLTRITGSGLSITEWDVIMGAIPPLTDTQWHDAFAKYQRIPQYIHENAGMSLEAFKGIFWWEWAHRLLGRLLGFLFLIPFLWFAWTGAIKRAEWPRMIVLFFLGGLQGAVGWWMVQSGLETRVSVSQYRLAIHLGVALILFVAMVYIALEYLRLPETRARTAAAWPKLPTAFGVLVYIQMLLGALVAGLHAGLIYNTWPSMDGRFAPEDLFAVAPWWLNFFENPGTAQFDHRIGAYIVVATALTLWWRERGKLTGYAGRSGNALLHITLFQVALGIATLLLQAPEFLAAAHQLVAALLLCTAVWHIFELRQAHA